jgi:hypothetical protein
MRLPSYYDNFRRNKFRRAYENFSLILVLTTMAVVLTPLL